MSTITLPNIRVGSDLQIRVRLKDGGVAIDWSTLSNIKARIYSDAQRAMAGRCTTSIDGEDPTLLVCDYSATKPQYLGVNRIIVCATYRSETKTYDKPAFTFVRWTADQTGEEVTIDDPEVDVEIVVEDMSSSILDEAVQAALSAAERADEAAAAAEHMVDIKTGPVGKSPYKGENGNWFEWDEESGQYVDTGVRAKGEDGVPGTTPHIGQNGNWFIGDVDTGVIAEGHDGEDGVGFDDVTTQQDGTLVITLTNGDTITIDLNHVHPQYYSKEVETSQPQGGFLPDVIYKLGTITGSVTFALAAAVTGYANHYFIVFDTSSTAPTITWPAGLTWADGSAPTVAASKHYEVSIMDGIAAYLEV